jgi:predicted O-linked N-acetylglucosamine transferase (SPINDLY family)
MDLQENNLFQDTCEAILKDNLNIIIYLDATTNAQGWEFITSKLAPVQASWLGGDSPGLPEIDYFLVDPYVLPEEAQEDYTEELLRLSSFISVGRFNVDSINIASFRNFLKIPDDTCIFWTSSIAYKRYVDCIDAQIEIIKQVPNSVLVIRGTSDLASMVKIYKSAAIEKDVYEKLRFLEVAPTSSRHRAELGLADIMLDTFPYTGATQTMEALWRGVPVLTKVGNHYYGRMSYSLLKNAGLEECITWSIEDYIKQGVKLGLNLESTRKIKTKLLQESRRASLLWHPREFIRDLESACEHMADKRPAHEFHSTYHGIEQSAYEWNQLGYQLIQEVDTYEKAVARRQIWETALRAWRHGLSVDAYHIGCWFNYIHGLFVLGEKERSLEEASKALHYLLGQNHDMPIQSLK